MLSGRILEAFSLTFATYSFLFLFKYFKSILISQDHRHFRVAKHKLAFIGTNPQLTLTSGIPRQSPSIRGKVPASMGAVSWVLPFRERVRNLGCQTGLMQKGRWFSQREKNKTVAEFLPFSNQNKISDRIVLAPSFASVTDSSHFLERRPTGA